MRTYVSGSYLQSLDRTSWDAEDPSLDLRSTTTRNGLFSSFDSRSLFTLAAAHFASDKPGYADLIYRRFSLRPLTTTTFGACSQTS